SDLEPRIRRMGRGLWRPGGRLSLAGPPAAPCHRRPHRGRQLPPPPTRRPAAGNLHSSADVARSSPPPPWQAAQGTPPPNQQPPIAPTPIGGFFPSPLGDLTPH